MITLKKILVPTDFSDFSERALRYACALVEQFDAELHLLHVFQEVTWYSPEAVGIYTRDEYQKWKSQAAESLSKVLDANWSAGRSIVRSIRDGTPFFEIIQYARQTNMDLIVMATHGRTGLSHVLLGSVAERVVRKSPCPVLTIRDPDHTFVMP